MKRDHYIIPICSLSTSIEDAICYLTQLTKFVLQFVCFVLRQRNRDAIKSYAHYSETSVLLSHLTQKWLNVIRIN